jgi:CheY-like chemotaxis protein
MTDLRTILLVEDDLKDVELTLEALSEIKLANHVTVVHDGVEALEFLRYEGKFKNRRHNNPAVILLDIKMPRMDGLELLHTIRNDARFKKIPVVMMTSSREESDLKKSYEFGTNAFVVKPVNSTEFIHAVKQVGVFWALINEIPNE